MRQQRNDQRGFADSLQHARHPCFRKRGEKSGTVRFILRIEFSSIYGIRLVCVIGWTDSIRDCECFAP
jgi:hypothetical protein